MTAKEQAESSLASTGILILVPMLFGSWLWLTSVADIVPGIAPFDGKRMLELCLIFLTLALCLLNTGARHRIGLILTSCPGKIRLLSLVFFGIGAISALRTTHPAYPLTDAAMLFTMALSRQPNLTLNRN